MSATYLLSACRSPVAPRDGALAHLDIHDLASPVLIGALKQAGVRPNDVDEIIVGNALGAGGNPARLVALTAGLPQNVAGLSIDRQCCSGMDALVIGDAMIRSGQANIVVAGGVESYSRRPLRFRTYADCREPEAYDQPAFAPTPENDPDMSQAADQLATDQNISRRDQDVWAVESHRKARAAVPFSPDELIQFEAAQSDGFTRDLTLKLCERAPKVAGSVSTANTSVAADAAAFCVLVSENVAESLQNKDVEFIAGVTRGDRPNCPGLAPVVAIHDALLMANVTVNDLSVVEVMEAYAVQAIACVDAAGFNPSVTNLGGGSLARGHPIGASGAINAVRLFHELRKRPGLGLATIAAAGGLGTAIVLKAHAR